MKKTLTPKLKRYYKQINRAIPKNQPHRADILAAIKHDVSSYISDYPDVSYDEVLAHFGTPEDLSISFAESLSSHEIVKMSQRNKKHHIVIISGFLATVCVLCGTIYYVNSIADHTIAEIDETITIYPEITLENE